LADQTMQGNYTYTAPGLPPELPVACTMHVVSATSKKTTPELESLNWGGDAHLTGGLWTILVNRSDGF
jgi:hypothetical protein